MCFKCYHYYHAAQSGGAMAQGSDGESGRLLGEGGTRPSSDSSIMKPPASTY
jgi:hypothetical protein